MFGAIDTGVPNRKRDDGPTFLDLVWDQAPFLDHDAFVATVTHTAGAFVEAGVLIPAERDLVVSHAIQSEQELEPEPTWNVEVEARTRPIGANAYLSVNVRNADDVPLTIEIVTPYGSRTVTGVVPGSSAHQSFNTRQASVPAGSGTVNVTGMIDGVPVMSQFEVPYGQGSCATP